MRQVSKHSDVPMGHHFAVLIYKTSTVWIPGDERSRTNPGHGYPARTESYDNFEHYVTEDKSDWENFVRALHLKQEKNFVFFEVQKLGSMIVNVSII